MSAAQQPETIRRSINYIGRVQGVFFRATSSELAQNFRVSGFVRNLPDGSVELEAEGPPEEVEGFLEAVEAHFRDNIRSKDVQTVEPRGERGFEVRY